MKLLGKVSSLLISGLVFFCTISQPISAQETIQNDTNSVEDMYDAGYEIVMEDNNIVQFKSEDKVIMEAEYEGQNRVSKVGQQNCVYVYQDGFLITENRDGEVIEYYNSYDINIDSYRYTGYTVNGEIFNYIYDDNHLIIGITDQNGVEIAKYIYEGLHVTDVLSFNGEEWVSNNDEEFCGNYNRIRSYGTYYDIETGLYYSNGSYDDVIHGKIVGLRENNSYLTEANPFALQIDSEVMPFGYEEQDLEATVWAEALLKNSSFNAAKPSDYYKSSNTATVEIIARLIYGENNVRELDQRAIAWVLLNRYNHHSSQFGSTLREVAIKNYHFIGVNSAVAIKTQSSADARWRDAVYFACLMLTDSSEGCWNVISPKPKGITNQIYFRSASKLGQASHVFESGGKLYVSYGNGKNVEISNACIAGAGTATTVSGLKALCTSSLTHYNVFFYHN